MARYCHKHTKLSSLFNNLFKNLKTVILPVFTLSIRLIRKNIMSFINDKIQIFLIVVKLFMLFVQFADNKKGNHFFHLNIYVIQVNDYDVGIAPKILIIIKRKHLFN